MNSRERFEFYTKSIEHYKQTPESVVADLVNRLIEALYIPVEGYESITQVDHKRLEHFEIADDEPINWGDLKCREVEKFANGTFFVVIDEAAPKGCETFCDYIQKYMKSYGWDCRVETEW